MKRHKQKDLWHVPESLCYRTIANSEPSEPGKPANPQPSQNGTLGIMLMTWEEADRKLKIIYDYLEHKMPKWSEAGAVAEEIMGAGLPNDEYHRLGASRILPPTDLDGETFHQRLSSLRTAMRKNDKTTALKNLSETQKALDALKRRQH